MTRPAGWHRDPDGTGALRYWDGESWADQSTPAPAEEPQAAKRSGREWMVLAGLGGAIVLLVGAIVAAVILAMGMDLGEPTVTAETTSAKASAPAATLGATAIETTAVQDTGAEQPQVAVGEEARDGNFSFVVTGVKRADSVAHPERPEIEKAAQGEFVMVQMHVTNVGVEPQKFFVSFNTLSDGSAVYKSDDEAWLYLGNTVADLNPGDSIDTVTVFDVPRGAAATSVELHDGPSSTGVRVGL